VPEPGSAPLAGLAVSMLAFALWKRRSR
jgi:MYXO-CTERM domain-containing protein